MVGQISESGAGPEEVRARRAFADNPLHELMGLTVEDAGVGFARLRMQTNRLTGGQGEGAIGGGVGGSVHGGLLAALVDIAALQAVVHSLQPGDRPAGTADLGITYLRPAMGDSIVAEATILRKGRQMVVIEVSIIDASDRLCSKARVIYALRQEARPGTA